MTTRADGAPIEAERISSVCRTIFSVAWSLSLKSPEKFSKEVIILSLPTIAAGKDFKSLTRTWAPFVSRAGVSESCRIALVYAYA